MLLNCFSFCHTTSKFPPDTCSEPANPKTAYRVCRLQGYTDLDQTNQYCFIPLLSFRLSFFLNTSCYTLDTISGSSIRRSVIHWSLRGFIHVQNTVSFIFLKSAAMWISQRVCLTQGDAIVIKLIHRSRSPEGVCPKCSFPMPHVVDILRTSFSVSYEAFLFNGQLQ